MPVEQETVVEGQENGQENQPENQSETVENDDGMYVRVPRTNYANLAPDGDFNKVVHMAKEYVDLKSSGLLALGQQLADNNLTPYEVLAGWAGGEEPGQAPGKQEPPPVQQPPQEQQGQEGRYVTPDQLEQMVQDRIDQGFQKERSQREIDMAMNAQEAAITASLESLGFAPQPMKFNIAGTDEEITPVRDLIVDPAIRFAAQRIHARNLNPQAPDYEQQLYGPMSAQTVKEATAVVKQVFGMIGQAQLEQEADNQANLPQGSLAQGAPGGRVKEDPKDMTEEQKRRKFEEWEREKLAARGDGGG